MSLLYARVNVWMGLVEIKMQSREFEDYNQCVRVWNDGACLGCPASAGPDNYISI